MKLILAVLCLALFPLKSHAAEYSRDYLEKKRTGFAKMRTTGFVMGGAGCAMVVLGGFLVGTAKYENSTDYNGNPQRVTHDPQWPVGFLTIVAGVPIGIAGAVLGGIGSNKVTQYDRMLRDFTLGLELNPERSGARVSLSF
jgi:hypothetical protein